MSVTTVPIRPIKKGSLTKYWIAIVLVLTVAAVLAWLGTKGISEKYQTNAQYLASNSSEDGVKTSKTGVQTKVIKTGEGRSPNDDDVVVIGYKGTFRDGTVFDQQEQSPIPVTGVIPGFTEALKKMQTGGKYKIWIPSDQAYGPEPKTDPQTGKVVMPANSLLLFEVELKDIVPRAEFEKRMAEVQKAQQAQQRQGGAGGPGGRGGPPQGAAGPASGPEGNAQGLPPEIQAQLEAQMRAQQGQSQGQGQGQNQ